MIVLALAAPAIVQSIAPAFAPPLDRAIDYSVSEVREDATRTQRFRIDRRVVFRRAGDGFTAVVETLAVSGDAGGAARMFVGMARAMLGRRVVVTLDGAGTVIAVADLDRLWDAQMAAIATTLATKDPARAATTDAMLAPLRALPDAGKVARLGDMVTALIASGPTRPSAERAMTQPARAQDGTPTTLAGTERVVAEADGTITHHRRLSGPVGGSTTDVVLRRRIDPRTGLIVAATKIDTIIAGDARFTITRTTTVLP